MTVSFNLEGVVPGNVVFLALTPGNNAYAAICATPELMERMMVSPDTRSAFLALLLASYVEVTTPCPIHQPAQLGDLTLDGDYNPVLQ